MNQRGMRRWHRLAGIVLAPFLLLQAVSGLILTYGIFTRVSGVLAADAPPPVRTAWNLLMAKMHFGPGLIGWIYHSAIGLGLVWMIGSGLWIWFDLKRRQNRGNSEE